RAQAEIDVGAPAQRTRHHELQSGRAADVREGTGRGGRAQAGDRGRAPSAAVLEAEQDLVRFDLEVAEARSSAPLPRERPPARVASLAAKAVGGKRRQA